MRSIFTCTCRPRTGWTAAWPATSRRHLHKTSIVIDISGWSPRRIPAEVLGELKGRLSGQFVWGSDFPFLTPERCLAEFDGLGLPDQVREQVLHGNAARILRLG